MKAEADNDQRRQTWSPRGEDVRKFNATVERVQRATSSRYWAALLINPKEPRHYGAIRISFPRFDIGTAHCVAWMPMPEDHPDKPSDPKFASFGKYGTVTAVHYGSSWYMLAEQRQNASTRVLKGAEFLNLKTGRVDVMNDRTYWVSQLERAGYVVAFPD